MTLSYTCSFSVNKLAKNEKKNQIKYHLHRIICGAQKVQRLLLSEPGLIQISMLTISTNNYQQHFFFMNQRRSLDMDF